MTETVRASGASKDNKAEAEAEAIVRMMGIPHTPNALTDLVVENIQWRAAAQSDGEAYRAELAIGAAVYALAVLATIDPSQDHPLAAALRGVL